MGTMNMMIMVRGKAILLVEGTAQYLRGWLALGILPSHRVNLACTVTVARPP